MLHYIAAAVILLHLANSQATVVRCGPCFDYTACPWNDDGLGRINYCTKFGFCGSTAAYKSQQDAGDYICSRTLDGSVDTQDVCRDQTNPDAWCASNILNGSTCSLNDGRCEIKSVDATTFTGYHAGTNAPGADTTTTTTTTTTGTTGTVTNKAATAAPTLATASDSTSATSSSASSSLILPSIAMAMLLSAGIMVL